MISAFFCTILALDNIDKNNYLCSLAKHVILFAVQVILF